MNPRITVTRDGDQVEVTCKPADMVRFERHFGTPIVAFDESPRMEWALFLAWSAERRESGITDEFDDYVERVEEVQIGTGGAPPLEPAP